MPDSHNISRRDFVTVVTAFVGAVMGTVIGLPSIGYLISPALKTQKSEGWIPLGPLENYPEGVPTLFNFTRAKVNGWEKSVNSYGVYVLRRGEQVVVLSNKCTHLSCRVTWSEEGQHYICPCHDAQFTIEGAVAGGPPPRPLQDFKEVKIEEGNVSFFFKEGEA